MDECREHLFVSNEYHQSIEHTKRLQHVECLTASAYLPVSVCVCVMYLSYNGTKQTTHVHTYMYAIYTYTPYVACVFDDLIN